MVADLDGDEDSELLLLQAAGQLQAAHCRGREDLDETDRRHFCLTAMRCDGSMLWQIGEPWPDPTRPFTCHGSGNQITVADINDDRRPEMIAVRGDELLMIEGASASCWREPGCQPIISPESSRRGAVVTVATASSRTTTSPMPPGNTVIP